MHLEQGLDLDVVDVGAGDDGGELRREGEGLERGFHEYIAVQE